MSWQPPPTFDEYRLLRPLGAGAMGQVFLAQDTVLDRAVAVKFLAGGGGDPVHQARMLVEARAIARLQHPNVVSVYRVGAVDGRPYLVSELVRGVPLSQLAKPLAPEEVVRIGLGLARALAAAHRRGVLHRDIKPANAMLTEEGEAKLLDFGLAKILEPEGGAGPAAGPPEPPAAPAVMPADALAATLGSGEHAPVEATLTEGGSIEPAPPAPRDAATMSVERGFLAAADREIGPQGAMPLTRAGSILGTPLYMAPEVWRGEPATARSHVSSMGALLHELATGQPPHRAQSLRELGVIAQTRDVDPLADSAPGVDPGLADLVGRCLRRDPTLRFASGEELRDALEQLAEPRRRVLLPAAGPYRGLETFDAEHRACFFGRDREIHAVVERLRTDPMVLVTGDSGVGKSSLCRAGVLPVLGEGALAGGRSWAVVRMVPGRTPLQTLASVLAPLLDAAPDVLVREVRADAAHLGRTLRAWCGATRGLVLYLDQLEELVTLAERGEAEPVAAALEALAATAPAVRVLGSARGDFLTRLAALPGFGEAISRWLYVLGPLSAADIREVIAGPARLCGVRFEPAELVDHLAEQYARAEGGLPLLQFALAELWEARDRERGVIPLSALAAIGGVEGALGRHADGVLAALLPVQRVAARRILSRLISAAGTRVRRSEAELCAGDAAAPAALSALLRGRLLLAREAREGTAYEVAHEVLVRGWATLRGWLDEDAGKKAVEERLRIAVAEWQRLGRASEGLWDRKRIDELDGLELLPAARDFVRASRRALRRRVIARVSLLLAPPLLAGATYFGVQIRARQVLRHEVDQLLGRSARTLAAARGGARDLQERRRQAFALFDLQQAQTAEKAWRGVLELTPRVDSAYAEASRAAETALMRDPGRLDARRLLGDILLERAVEAEAGNQIAYRDELASRLRVYDQEGSIWRRWTARAAVDVETYPSGAEARIESYSQPVGDHWLPSEPRSLGTTPLRNVELAPGSYRFLIAGSAGTVRYPVEVQRGQRKVIRIHLDPALPMGYILQLGVRADGSLHRQLQRRRDAQLHHLLGLLARRHRGARNVYRNRPPRRSIQAARAVGLARRKRRGRAPDAPLARPRPACPRVGRSTPARPNDQTPQGAGPGAAREASPAPRAQQTVALATTPLPAPKPVAPEPAFIPANADRDLGGPIVVRIETASGVSGHEVNAWLAAAGIRVTSRGIGSGGTHLFTLAAGQGLPGDDAIERLSAHAGIRGVGIGAERSLVIPMAARLPGASPPR